jgi:hypothetical protein
MEHGLDVGSWEGKRTYLVFGNIALHSEQRGRGSTRRYLAPPYRSCGGLGRIGFDEDISHVLFRDGEEYGGYTRI